MTVRVAINGFGRIGRNVLRAIAESRPQGYRGRRASTISGRWRPTRICLRFDSVHGRFPGEVKVKGDTIIVGNGAIKVTAIKDPADAAVEGRSASISRWNAPASSPPRTRPRRI